MRKKLVLMMLIFALAAGSIPMHANAEVSGESVTDVEEGEGKPGITPFFKFVHTLVVDFDIYKGVGYGTTRVTGYFDDVDKISTYVSLEQEKGTGFVTIANWSKRSFGFSQLFECEKKLPAKGRYRLKADFYVYNPQNYCECLTFYSSIETYK